MGGEPGAGGTPTEGGMENSGGSPGEGGSVEPGTGGMSMMGEGGAGAVTGVGGAAETGGSAGEGGTGEPQAMHYSVSVFDSTGIVSKSAHFKMIATLGEGLGSAATPGKSAQLSSAKYRIATGVTVNTP